MPSSDPYIQCLFCLGKKNIKERFLICKSFKKRIQVARNLHLKQHLMEQAMRPTSALGISTKCQAPGGHLSQPGLLFSRIPISFPGGRETIFLPLALLERCLIKQTAAVSSPLLTGVQTGTMNCLVHEIDQGHLPALWYQGKSK